MGNCMKASKQTEQEEGLNFDLEEEEKDQKAKVGESLKESSSAFGSAGVRVKLVLTKEELEWLVFQLKSNSEGGKVSLESALGEIEKGRERVKVVESTWKPSLESISELD